MSRLWRKAERIGIATTPLTVQLVGSRDSVAEPDPDGQSRPAAQIFAWLHGMQNANEHEALDRTDKDTYSGGSACTRL